MATTRSTDRPSRGLAAKRSAIVIAARRAFGRTGYLGTSVEMIAAEAQVSTRTIYNHFLNKEELFASVTVESSGEVAVARERLIERRLGGRIEDLEAALVELAYEWLLPDESFHDHFVLVREIRAAPDRFPEELQKAWREAGPHRARRALADQMERLTGEGLLQVADPMAAAQHFTALITSADMLPSEFSLSAGPDEVRATAVAGVRAFLYGYLPR
ncbi:TetR/AcrR family transcriptional regulator [Pseudonocardia tropica]|uniref:TetR/AcrR family transcriptional regulator n=1 Tax=Pseudonocardia tropica TaxID=681289 RepID=A0ABV1K0B5_9PSEU